MTRNAQNFEHVSWKTYLSSRVQHVKGQMQYDRNARGQSPFGIRCFTLIDLCLLSGFVLSLELVAQGEQPPLRHLSYVMHIEDEDLENDDVRSIPTVLGSHRQEKRQRPARTMRSNPKIDWVRGVRDNETNRPHQCREAAHTQSKERYRRECRSVTDRLVGLSS